MPAALIVSGGTRSALRLRFDCNPRQEAVERQIEIQARLFAIADDVEAGRDLVVYCGRDGVVQELGYVVRAKFVEVGGDKLQPTWERIAADDRCAKGILLHETAQPPSMPTTCPVMWRDSSPRRNSAVAATSAASSSPALKGCLWAMNCRISSSDCARALMGVRTSPGAITLTRILCGA